MRTRPFHHEHRGSDEIVSKTALFIGLLLAVPALTWPRRTVGTRESGGIRMLGARLAIRAGRP